MTTARATRKRAGHFARRVREGPPESRDTSNGSAHVRFPIGRLFATPGALSALARARDFGKPYSVQRANESEDRMSQVLPYVWRHAWGDWGDVSADDGSGERGRSKRGCAHTLGLRARDRRAAMDHYGSRPK